jgi:hypothetical protein
MPKPDRIIHLRTILDRTGSSRSPLSRKIAEMTFPGLPHFVWRNYPETGDFRRDSDEFEEALVARERCFG